MALKPIFLLRDPILDPIKRPMQTTSYRGRFAPSPSGPLHFGSLLTALGSYLDAKSQGGLWFLRIDDLDPPRIAPGATDAILRALEVYGLEWDGAVQYQNQCSAAYVAAFAKLQANAQVYACACSRREIADSHVGPAQTSIYPGTCRQGLAPGKTARMAPEHTGCASELRGSATRRNHAKFRSCEWRFRGAACGWLVCLPTRRGGGRCRVGDNTRRARRGFARLHLAPSVFAAVATNNAASADLFATHATTCVEARYDQGITGMVDK